MKICMHTNYSPFQLSLNKRNDETVFNPDKIVLKGNQTLNQQLPDTLKPINGLYGCYVNDSKVIKTWEEYTIDKFEAMFFDNQVIKNAVDRGIDIYTNKEWIDSNIQEIIAFMETNTAMFRENSFYYVVDEDKLFNPTSTNDIYKYLRMEKEGTSSNFRPNHAMLMKNEIYMDFEQMQKDGYEGFVYSIEDHKRLYSEILKDNYTYRDPFDTDQCAIWSSESAYGIPKEIAHISKFTSDSIRIFDSFDKDMNPERLKEWALSYREDVQEAIDKNILTRDEVNYFLSHTKEMEAKILSKEEVGELILSQVVYMETGKYLEPNGKNPELEEIEH